MIRMIMASATWWGQFQHDRQWHRHRPHHPHWENDRTSFSVKSSFNIWYPQLRSSNTQSLQMLCWSLSNYSSLKTWTKLHHNCSKANIRLKILTKSTSNFVLVLVPKKNDDQHNYDHHDYDHHDYHRDQQVTMAAPNADKGNWVGVKTKESRRILQHTITITKCKYEYKYNCKCKMIDQYKYK